MELTEEQWNNIKKGDTLVSADGSLFYVISKVKDGRRDFCVVRRVGGISTRIVYQDDHHDIIDVDKE